MTPNSICGRNSFFYLFLYLAAAVAAAEFASSITYWATARPPARVAHHGTWLLAERGRLKNLGKAKVWTGRGGGGEATDPRDAFLWGTLSLFCASMHEGPLSRFSDYQPIFREAGFIGFGQDCIDCIALVLVAPSIQFKFWGPHQILSKRPFPEIAYSQYTGPQFNILKNRSKN